MLLEIIIFFSLLTSTLKVTNTPRTIIPVHPKLGVVCPVLEESLENKKVTSESCLVNRNLLVQVSKHYNLLLYTAFHTISTGLPDYIHRFGWVRRKVIVLFVLNRICCLRYIRSWQDCKPGHLAAEQYCKQDVSCITRDLYLWLWNQHNLMNADPMWVPYCVTSTRSTHPNTALFFSCAVISYINECLMKNQWVFCCAV